MKKRTLPTITAALIFTVFSLLSMIGCEDPSASVSRPVIDPPDIELRNIKISPWVTKAGKPFTLEVIVRGVEGSELHLYPTPGVTLNPDGTVTQPPPSGLMQNGTEPEYLVLHKDETYTENQVYLESRFIANDVVLKNEASGIAVSTVRNIRLEDPATILEFKIFRVLLPFRTADPAVLSKPEINQLDTDVQATSRVVNIISEEAYDVSTNRMYQVGQRFFDFFPDDLDFLVVQKPANADISAGGYFFISGAREKGLGDDAFRDSNLFGSAVRLKGVIQSLRGIYSLGTSGKKDFCLLTHEILHRWAAHMGEPLSPDGSHWNTDPVSGLDRDHSGFGFTGSCNFNDFELYLAGFIPADSVDVPLNQDGYTIGNFINDFGEREPVYPDTQRKFNIGLIIDSDQPLSEHEMAYFHFLAEEVAKPSSPFSQTWYQSTGSRSTLNSQLPPPRTTLP